MNTLSPRNKWVTITLHAAFWVLVFALPFLLRPSSAPERQERDPNEVIQYIINDFFWVAYFYFNAFFLIPRLLNKKNRIVFAVATAGMFGFFVLSGWLNHKFWVDDIHFSVRRHLIFTFLIFTFMFAASTAYRLIIERLHAEQLQKERENENLKTELSLLRSQVSPHFMFNVLNNMVALARKKSDLLEPSLIQLSSLMRYMLYDADGDKVSLEKEVDYLQSYIDLQRLRFGKNIEVNVKFFHPNGTAAIEPMLLIPFVENAFKHGTGFMEHPQIDILLEANEQELRFEVRNRFNPESEEIKDKTSGIGLTNVKRRLELLYGANHQLNITKNEGWFTTALHLKLS